MTRDDLYNASCLCLPLSVTLQQQLTVSPLLPTFLSSQILSVNSTVPIITSRKAGVYNPTRLFGVTTLDVVRAACFTAGIAGAKPADSPVTVVGGHSGAIIVPLLSQNVHGKAITGDTYKALVHRIQFNDDEVVKAKDGAGISWCQGTASCHR
ncbi:hypothetical protein BDR07DRAFT_210201 [Suillus spraguei]|nr:hypothetical protein BDR07DRAFT_210201 [Suillus spraguei]